MMYQYLMLSISIHMTGLECVFSWKSVADYIDQQFEQYFRDESGLNRKNIQDNRVHCCLYFISPFGHGYEHYDLIRPDFFMVVKAGIQTRQGSSL